MGRYACLLSLCLAASLGATPVSARPELEPARSAVRETVEPQVHPRRIVVHAADEAEPGLREADRRLGVVARRPLDGLDAWEVELPSGIDASRAADLYDAVPGVEEAAPALIVRALGEPEGDPLYGQQHHLPAVQASQAWDYSRGSSSRVVAVVDTGVYAAHEDLSGRVLAGYDAVDNDLDASDPHGHGTLVAGVLAATGGNGKGGTGVTLRDMILPVRVLGTNGEGTDASVADGIRWAAAQGADIINLSLGTAGYSRVMADAVRYAQARGALVVAAAGNDGLSAPSSPSSFPGVVNVGAVDEAGELPEWTNYGSTLDLVAPGTSIIGPHSAPATYVMADGTSVAAPIVSGIAALVWAKNPSMTASQVAARLTSTTDDLGQPGRDRWFGAGRVNAYRAVTGGASTRANAQTEPDGEPSDTLETAVPLDGTAGASLYPSGDQDWWRIDVPQGGHLSVTAVPAPSVDVAVEVYGPDYSLVAEADSGFKGVTEALRLNLAGGRHYVGVRNWLPSAKPDDSYSLTLQAGDGPGGAAYVVPAGIERSFFPWYDAAGSGGRNWLMTSIVDGSSGTYRTTVAGDDVWASEIGAGPESEPVVFGGLRGGPVETRYARGTAIVASQRALWTSGNFEETPATTQLTTRGWFSWYDGVGTKGQDWVVAANPGPWSVRARIRFQSATVAERTLAPGQTLVWRDRNKRGGPVQVESVDGRPLLASRRTLWGGTNFSELPAVRSEDLSDGYVFPWYDAVGTAGRNWILIANPGAEPLVARVRIGGEVDETFTVAPGASVFPAFAGIRGGPVRVTASRPFIATQRSLYDDGKSFEEVAGVPMHSLPDEAHFTWYDAVGSNGRDWVLVANPSESQSVGVTIRIAGQVRYTGTVAPGETITPTFEGVRAGPVTVEAGGPIVTSRRTMWGNDFTEITGAP